MYDDSKELLEFLEEKKIVISLEGWGIDNKVKGLKALNSQNWSEIEEKFNKNGFAVVDNFLNLECAQRLRNFTLCTNYRSGKYLEYAALDFQRPQRWFPLLTNITEEMKEEIPMLKELEFQRSWAFIHKNNATGVGLHADPANININLWVAPDECVLDPEKNGLIIWDKKAPDDWVHKNYNGSLFKCRTFLAENHSQPNFISYKFNRAMIFNSSYFHETAGVSMKPGYTNRRINYTFLYGFRQ